MKTPKDIPKPDNPVAGSICSIPVTAVLPNECEMVNGVSRHKDGIIGWRCTWDGEKWGVTEFEYARDGMLHVDRVDGLEIFPVRATGEKK